MYKPRLVLFVLIAAHAACGGVGSPSSPTPALTLNDLVGSWIATSVVNTNQATPSQTIAIIAAGGEVRFTMLSGGGTRNWVEFGTFSDEWDAVVTLNGSTATSVPVETSRPTAVASATLVNGVLTLTNRSALFDFTLTGATPVAATQVSVFVRN